MTTTPIQLKDNIVPVVTETRPMNLPAVIVMAFGHFVHDAFTSFLSPLLPLIIQKLSLSLTLAGSLAAMQGVPSLITPLLGMMGDRFSLRWLAIIAPTVTAIAMSLAGAAPTYTVLAVLLLVAGISSASWHVPSPVMVARSAGRRVGLGMSILMLGGELARTIGPLIAVAAVSLWGLEGMWRLIPLGVIASLILFWRTKNIEARHTARTVGSSWKETWVELQRVMLPIAGIIGARTFISVSLATYLPTLLTREGSTLVQAGGTFSVLMLAGALGSFATGTLSDRLGRQRVLLTILTLSPILMAIFLSVQGWLQLPVLFVLGLMALSSSPVLMAMVQEVASNHPATANGLYMALEFISGSITTVVIGVLADRFGLREAFMISAAVAIFGVPFVFLLPRKRAVKSQTS